MRSVIHRRGVRSAIALAALLAAPACDLSVTNPGPVRDDALDQASAFPALVGGMARTLSRALAWVALTGSVASRELTSPGGGTVDAFNATLLQTQGVLDPAVGETDQHWRYAQQARWVAEDGIRRMRRVLGERFETSPLAAQALLYAGYANRLLGENMCVGVIDGGPAEPRDVYLRRAEAAFTEAAAVSGRAGDTTIAAAARAGRAAVRAWLGNWEGAAADARSVSPGFVYQARYAAVELEQYNRLYWANANQPYRALSVWGTFYEGYYTQSRDPRVAWTKDPKFPNTVTGGPWYVPSKYTKRESPITLSSGREMRLLLAEAALRAGDWQGALGLLNQRRAEVGAALLSAADAAAAWSALKRERGIELWLEGRRLGDLFRWLGDGSPGVADDIAGRSTCFPVGQSELDANPNLARAGR